MDVVTKRAVHWIGEVPETCQLSRRKITNSFVDGVAPGHRFWALMHPTYYRQNGGEFGTGRGQLYVRQDDGRWLKTEG